MTARRSSWLPWASISAVCRNPGWPRTAERRRSPRPRDLAAACSAEIRTVTYLLHPPLLDEVGLAARVAGLRAGFQPAHRDPGRDRSPPRFRPAQRRAGSRLSSASSRKGWRTSTSIRAARRPSSGWNGMHTKSGWYCRTGAAACPRRCGRRRRDSSALAWASWACASAPNSLAAGWNSLRTMPAQG